MIYLFEKIYSDRDEISLNRDSSFPQGSHSFEINTTTISRGSVKKSDIGDYYKITPEMGKFKITVDKIYGDLNTYHEWSIKLLDSNGRAIKYVNADIYGNHHKNKTITFDAENGETFYLEIIANGALSPFNYEAELDPVSILKGSINYDFLYGTSADDIIEGGDGNDTIKGSLGLDSLDGGDGSDTLDYSTETQPLRIILNSNKFIVVDYAYRSEEGAFFYDRGKDYVANFENVAGGVGDDYFKGDLKDNSLAGGDGKDWLSGSIGNDLLDGGSGSDTADYSEKNKSVRVILNGAIDVFVYIDNVIEDTIRNVENITGGSGSDAFTGDSYNNIFIGNDGDDFFSSSAGEDRFDGGLGVDTVDYSEQDGDIRVYLNSSQWVSSAINNVDKDSLKGVENILGGHGDDYISGDQLGNYLSGGIGNDNLRGNSGNDTLSGDSGDDTINGGNGDDIIFADAGNDTLDGSWGFDHLIYSSNKDSFIIETRDGVTTVASENYGVDKIYGIDKISFNYLNILNSSLNLIAYEDKAINGTLAGIGIDRNVLKFATVSAPSSGTVSINEETGAYTYSPDVNYNGRDYFTFKVSDSTVESVVATVYISVLSVNDAPSATAATTATTFEDEAQSGTLTGTDVDGDTLTFVKVTDPTNGKVSVNSTTGTYTYTPNANFNGSDSFTFKVNDGTADSAVATVSITVASVGYDVSVKTHSWRGVALDGVQSQASNNLTNELGVLNLPDLEDKDGSLDGLITLSPSLNAPSTAASAGVTLTDVLAALKIYLGKPLPDAYASPYNYIAADFDGNGSVNLTDVLSLLKFYLGKPTQAAPSWVFVDAADVSGTGKTASILRAGSDTLPIDASHTQPHAIDQDFSIDTSIELVGVLRGDVDGSWTAGS